MQNAADAAVLGAVWYDPACQGGNAAWVTAGCQTGLQPSMPIAPECTQPPNAAFDPRPCTVAVNLMEANWGIALSLCAGPNLPSGAIPVMIDAHPGLPPPGMLNIPNVTPYVVTLSCDAPHWFARIFPRIQLTTHISASASAALGWLGPNGQMIGGPGGTQLVARLII